MEEAAPKILELNAFDMNAVAGLAPAVASLVKRRRKTFGPTSMLFYERPLNLVRARRRLAPRCRWNALPRRLQQRAVCGTLSSPASLKLSSRQIATLNTHTRYLYDNIYTYANGF